MNITANQYYRRIFVVLFVAVAASTLFVTLTGPAYAQQEGRRLDVERLKEMLIDTLERGKGLITEFREKVVAAPKLPQEIKDSLTALIDEYTGQFDQFIADTNAATTMEELKVVLDAVKTARMSFVEDLKAIIANLQGSITAAKENCAPRKAAPYVVEMFKDPDVKKFVAKYIKTSIKDMKVLGCDLQNKTGNPDKFPSDIGGYAGIIFLDDEQAKSLGAINYNIALPSRVGFFMYFAGQKDSATVNLQLSGQTNLGIFASSHLDPQFRVNVTEAPTGTIVGGEGASRITCREGPGDSGGTCQTFYVSAGDLVIVPEVPVLKVGTPLVFTVYYGDKIVPNSSVVWALGGGASQGDRLKYLSLDKSAGSVTCKKAFDFRANPFFLAVTYQGNRATTEIGLCNQ